MVRSSIGDRRKARAWLDRETSRRGKLPALGGGRGEPARAGRSLCRIAFWRVYKRRYVTSVPPTTLPPVPPPCLALSEGDRLGRIRSVLSGTGACLSSPALLLLSGALTNKPDFHIYACRRGASRGKTRSRGTNVLLRGARRARRVSNGDKTAIMWRYLCGRRPRRTLTTWEQVQLEA